MSRVLILGGTGMLGSMCVYVLSKEIQGLCATFRDLNCVKKSLSNVNWLEIVLNDTFSNLEVLETLPQCDYVINCIGMTKPYVNDNDNESIIRAININSIFPRELDLWAQKNNCKIITIATDCVYSGTKGNYTETDLADATDTYGRTKYLGEYALKNTMILRNSIIGPELNNSSEYLLGWLCNQQNKAKINGFTNHLWNGVTTYHFAKLVCGIIKNNGYSSCLQHIVPKDIVNKYDLLCYLSKSFNREDLEITPIEFKNGCDRTLATNNCERNRLLWQIAGYKDIPTVAQMIVEMQTFNEKVINQDDNRDNISDCNNHCSC